MFASIIRQGIRDGASQEPWHVPIQRQASSSYGKTRFEVAQDVKNAAPKI